MTPARSPSAARSPASPYSPAPSSCWRCSAGCSSIQTLSVILQVGFFKATGGKRLFRMAPLHHHFEMMGWEEITVVIRFWLIAGIFVAAGLGVFYAEWVAGFMNLDDLGRTSDWSGVRVVVAGFGVSGYAAADNLTFLGAQVTALDESDAGDRAGTATLLESLGATVRLGPGSTASCPTTSTSW